MSNGVAAGPVFAPAGVAPRPVSARTKWLLEAPILSTLLRLSFPNFLNLVAISSLITFDGLFLGWLGPIALTGVSLVFPFVMAAHHVANSGMGGAVSSAVARALGAGARDRADALATHAFALAIGLGAFFSSLMLIIGPVLYRWMGGRGEIFEAAVTYSTIAFGGVISICLLSILANVVRATGNMVFPASVQLGAVLVHVLLSPLLIFGWGPVPAFGVAGSGARPDPVLRPGRWCSFSPPAQRQSHNKNRFPRRTLSVGVFQRVLPRRSARNGQPCDH
jgi:Na+-driven multidrug efflux pump